MGCGKTTVGKLLAKQLGCKCIDLDDYIEQQAGMSIPEIFSQKGEPYFRELETKALTDLAAVGAVVATGGGALLSDKNGEVAKSSGLAVFIDTDFDTCYDRIKDDPHRPIAASSTKEQLKERFDSRRPLYMAHSHSSVSGDAAPLAIAAEIAGLYKDRFGR